MNLSGKNHEKTMKKPKTYMDISNCILEGMKGVEAEMKAKGLLNDQTTFEEMATYAGQHILITEQREEKT